MMALINNNSLKENILLYNQDSRARKEMDQRARMECNCSEKSRGMLLDRSCSKSVKSYMSRKDKYASLHESVEENRTDTDYKRRENPGPHGFVPCRRICSTLHNPAFHQDRYGHRRGTSADDSKRKKAGNGLDWK